MRYYNLNLSDKSTDKLLDELASTFRASKTDVIKSSLITLILLGSKNVCLIIDDGVYFIEISRNNKKRRKKKV